jgi:peptidoglycan/xylan/chitin deacetylase (PgdA/CDA1 family)
MVSADKPKLLLVNYHYIREAAAYRYPGIHPLSPEKFRQQISSLKRRFHIAEPGEVEDFFLNGKKFTKPSVFITFDDGLVDHWQVAQDVLNPLGVKAAFFLCSRPALEGRALTVHKIHWLRAHTDPTDFTEELFSYFPASQRQQDDASWSEAAERMYIYDTPQIARLKFALNFVLPSDIIDDVTSRMFTKRGIDERTFCRQTYMADDQLRVLAEQGHLIGLHGHSHTPFLRLGDGVFSEVKQNQDYIARACGIKPTWVSYPNGRDDAIPDPLVLKDLFARLDLRFGFTTLGTWNEASGNPTRLNRINTNELEAVVGEVAPV